MVLAFSGEHVVTGMCAQARASHPAVSDVETGHRFPGRCYRGKGISGDKKFV